MNVCQICGKGTVVGRQHTHRRGVAGGRWKKKAPKTVRYFRPNLQRVTITRAGVRKTLVLCAKCLKRTKKDEANQSLLNMALG